MAYLSKYIDYKLTHTSLMHFVPPSWMEAPYHGKSAPFHVPDSVKFSEIAPWIIIWNYHQSINLTIFDRQVINSTQITWYIDIIS